MKQKLWMISFGVMLLIGVNGIAQEDMKEAKSLFKEGTKLFSKNRFEEAAAAFRKAYELKPNWKLYYNIGQCEAAAKRHGLALEAFEAYLAEGGDDIPRKRREYVIEEVERLRNMVGTVEVKAPEGASVIIDSVERGESPLPGPLLMAAGVTHQLKVVVGEETILEQSVKVSGGANIEVVAKEPEETPTAQPEVLEEPQAPTAEEPEEVTAPAQKKPSQLKIWGFVTLGVGGAALIGGSVTGGMALSLSDTLEKNCTDGDCPEPYWDDNNRLDDLVLSTNVLLIAGGTLAAAGAVMVIVAYSRGGKETQGDLALSPLIGERFVGAAVLGRF